jgi:hypothetical protein
LGLGLGLGLGLAVGVGVRVWGRVWGQSLLQIARAAAAHVLGGQRYDLVAELAEDRQLEREGGELLWWVSRVRVRGWG